VCLLATAESTVSAGQATSSRWAKQRCRWCAAEPDGQSSPGKDDAGQEMVLPNAGAGWLLEKEISR
jgi:hypothetical protein